MNVYVRLSERKTKMKTSQFIVAVSLIFAGITAQADYKAVASGSPADRVAQVANSILKVYTLELGDYVYQIVSMDSELNSDIGLTTMIMVGQGGVGGQAGYEAAFQVTPTGDLKVLDSAKVTDGKIELGFLDSNNQHVVQRVQYDPRNRTLKEGP